MTIFDLLSLFGGLAMFLYGMRLMGDGLKESSSGTLKHAIEYVTGNQIKAFLLGLLLTAIIQSSKATIVITSGLVAAGIISNRKSLGIVVGANVGTTVTGQIIRLLDVDSSASGILRLFTPSTLAPLSLIIGIILLMGKEFKNSKTIANIAIGFGILFTGLLTMTSSVDSVIQSGMAENLLTSLGNNPFFGFMTGGVVAFILQSASASVGILQAFSSSGQLTFNAIYAVIVGIFMGDCLTTGLVCSLGAKPEAKQVGVFNIIYNIAKCLMILIGVSILHWMGILDGLWNENVNSGIIADTNTIFNLVAAIGLFPFLMVFEQISERIVKQPAQPDSFIEDKMDGLNPVFFGTPALALSSCYDSLSAIFDLAQSNILDALEMIRSYDEKTMQTIKEKEADIDRMSDKTGNYMASLAPTLKQGPNTSIFNQYYKMVTDFERLGDYALNLSETAQILHDRKASFSSQALRELDIVQELLEKELACAKTAFQSRDIEAAMTIEPMEEVFDDLVDILSNNHLARLSKGDCNYMTGTNYVDVLGDLERISDICSNIGLAIVARVKPELGAESHEYSNYLHSGKDEDFNRRYQEVKEEYFKKLDEILIKS